MKRRDLLKAIARQAKRRSVSWTLDRNGAIQRMRTEARKAVVEVTYDVTAELGNRFWLVRVAALERVTQARNIGEIEPMAKELIELMTGESNPAIHVTLVLPKRIQNHLDRVAELRATEEQSRQSAAVEARIAARLLRESHLTLSDVGAVLGVSHQRAHQLIKS